jgi:hypothetical protein
VPQLALAFALLEALVVERTASFPCGSVLRTGLQSPHTPATRPQDASGPVADEATEHDYCDHGDDREQHADGPDDVDGRGR